MMISIVGNDNEQVWLISTSTIGFETKNGMITAIVKEAFVRRILAYLNWGESEEKLQQRSAKISRKVEVKVQKIQIEI